MINDRIRRARLLRGLSLEALASQLGDITKQGLSKYEKGLSAPNSQRLLQLAKALEVSPEYFFAMKPCLSLRWSFANWPKCPSIAKCRLRNRSASI